MTTVVSPTQPAAHDENLRRACRALDNGRTGRSVWLSALLFASALAIAFVSLSLAKRNVPEPVLLAVGVMTWLFVFSTLMAWAALRAMRRSVRWLDQDVGLPERLASLRQALLRPDDRNKGLDDLAQHLAGIAKQPSDGRVAAVSHRLHALVTAVRGQHSMARVHVSMARPAVDDHYKWRSGLHLMSQVLLYSGIIATLVGLFVSFNDDKLVGLLEAMRRAASNPAQFQSRFKDVMTGFTVAFGASAVGYVAFLCSRWQQEVADGYSSQVALLLENDLSEAVARALAPLAVETPSISPAMEQAVVKLQETLTGATAQQLDALQQLARSVAEGSAAFQVALEQANLMAKGFADLLTQSRQTWESAAQIWERASNQFADTASTASASIGGMAGQVTSAAQELKGAAHIVKVALENGLIEIIQKTDGQVQKFVITLESFQKLIEKQVADFHDAHSQVTQGRQQLQAAIESGEQNVTRVAELFRAALYEAAGVQHELATSVHTVGGGISQQLETLETSLRAVEAGGQRVEDRLDRLIGIASGVPMRDGRDPEGNGA